MSEPAGTNFVA